MSDEDRILRTVWTLSFAPDDVHGQRRVSAIMGRDSQLVGASLDGIDRSEPNSVRLLRCTAMRYSTNIKPISYVKAHAAEVLDDLAGGGGPVVITQNGEARAVLQDVKSYEATQETMALLKLLALGQQDIAAGRTVPLEVAVQRIRDRHGLSKAMRTR